MFFSRLHDIFEESDLKFAQKAQDIFLSNQNELFIVSEIKNLIFTFAVLLLNKMNDETMRLVSTFAIYQDVISYITEHCHAGITVNDMAQVMNMRREVFTRRFTLDTGISPKKIFNRFLLNKASKLLLQPHVTVREIAYELRFSSEYYFSRFFKRHTGVPPKQFQKLGYFMTSTNRTPRIN